MQDIILLCVYAIFLLFSFFYIFFYSYSCLLDSIVSRHTSHQHENKVLSAFFLLECMLEVAYAGVLPQ